MSLDAYTTSIGRTSSELLLLDHLAQAEAEIKKLKEFIRSLCSHFGLDDETLENIRIESIRRNAIQSSALTSSDALKACPCLLSLPIEVLSLAASYLDTSSLVRVLITCHELRDLFSADSIWDARFCSKWGMRMHKRAQMVDQSTVLGIQPQISWKKKYDKCEGSDICFKRGKAHVTEYFGHVGTVTCLQLLTGGRVISGSDDGSMLLWSRGNFNLAL
jgi:hypothetical protein